MATSPNVIPKGSKGGECNRTVCETPNAKWFNKSTRKYYCQSCALKIMSYPENKGLLSYEKDIPMLGKFVLVQSEHSLVDPDTEDKISVRTLQPSEPYGAWMGTPETIREWRILPHNDETSYRHCTDKEIVKYEEMLGEWGEFFIFTHRALGRVSSPGHP